MSVTTWTIRFTRYTSNARLGYKGVTLTSATYTPGNEDVVECDATSTSIIVTFPTPVGNEGKQYFVKRIDFGANTVTVKTAAGNIDGLTAITLVGNQNLNVVSDGTNWKIISNTMPTLDKALVNENGDVVTNNGEIVWLT